MAFKYLGVKPPSENSNAMGECLDNREKHFRGALLETAELEQNGIHYFCQEGKPFMLDWKKIQKMLRLSAGETK